MDDIYNILNEVYMVHRIIMGDIPFIARLFRMYNLTINIIPNNDEFVEIVYNNNVVFLIDIDILSNAVNINTTRQCG